MSRRCRRKFKSVDAGKAMEAACIAYRINNRRVFTSDLAETPRLIIATDKRPCKYPELAEQVQAMIAAGKNSKQFVIGDPMRKLIANKFRVSRRPTKTGMTVRLEKFRCKSNKKIMLDLFADRIPWEVADEDKLAMDKIDQALNFWLSDHLTGKMKQSSFNTGLFELCSKHEVETRDFSYICRLPMLAERDLRRRQDEIRILNECGSFPYGENQIVVGEFEVLQIKKHRRFASVYGILDSDGKYPAWFFCTRKAAAMLRRGTLLDIEAEVHSISRSQNTGIPQGRLHEPKYEIKRI